MVRTDNRHSNNTRHNRNIHTELDLWILYVNNNYEPIKLGDAVSKGRYFDSVWTLFYSPSDIAKEKPFLLTFKCGADFDSARFGTIQSAKYYLKKSDPQAKWQRQ